MSSRSPLVATLGLFAAGIFLGACAAGCGCSSEMRTFNVAISLDDSMHDAAGRFQTVEVDLVAVNSSELIAWQNKSMTDYFTHGDPLRTTAEKYTMHLGEGQKADTLRIDNAIWKTWHSHVAMNLLILSSYPRAVPDATGEQDPRRRILPLDKCRWETSTEPITVLVKPGGLTVLTPPKPEK